MRYLSVLLCAFLIAGCGGGGSDVVDDAKDKIDTTQDKIDSAKDKVDEKVDEVKDKVDEVKEDISGTKTETYSYTDITDDSFNKQWYLYPNSSFNTQYSISNDASVNIGDYINKYRGKGVKVAIIDDGFNVNNSELASGIISGYYSSAASSIGEVCSKGSCGHGTEVAGVLGARANGNSIAGIASESSMILLKYHNGIYYDTVSETLDLFKKAEEEGAQVINCSWGTGDVSDVIKEYIQELATTGRNGKGMIIVFASGNGGDDGIGDDIGNDESAIPEVIAVGATNANNDRAVYSDYGDNLDVLAPGGEGYETTVEHGILTLTSERYTNMLGALSYTEGTSFSAPLVTGAIALALEINPNLTRVQVDTLLKSTSDKVGSISYDANGFNKYYGYGKINVKKFLQAVENTL